MPEFREFDPEEWAGRPRRPAPLTGAEVIALGRREGIIPDDVDDGDIVVIGRTRHGDEVLHRPSGVRLWTAGDPLPHTSFDDPPVTATSEEYRELLGNLARKASSRDVFRSLLTYWLRADLEESHGVPADVAELGAMAFADRVYDEYGGS